MTHSDIVVLLLVAASVCWYFCTRRQKPMPRRYSSDTQATTKKQK